MRTHHPCDRVHVGAVREGAQPEVGPRPPSASPSPVNSVHRHPSPLRAEVTTESDASLAAGGKGRARDPVLPGEREGRHASSAREQPSESNSSSLPMPWRRTVIRKGTPCSTTSRPKGIGPSISLQTLLREGEKEPD